MLHLNTLGVLTIANIGLLAIALQLSGALMPETLKSYYAATQIWQRALIAGTVYAAIIVPFAGEFGKNPGFAGMLQGVFNALFILAMVVVVGGKPLNIHLIAATGIVALGGVYLAWAAGRI